MSKIGTVEDTLFVPMIGRIYASNNFPNILYDYKALELKDKLPKEILENDKQKQYTLIASASRSKNFDRYIEQFLLKHNDGIIVLLGCGLETSFYRNTTGIVNNWYLIDLENVIEYRKSIIEENENEICLSFDAFSEDWIKLIKEKEGDKPILVIASGLFYYFEEHTVIDLFKRLSKYKNIELVFDTVNKKGIEMMQKRYMKQVGHNDAKVFFYVDNINDLKNKINSNIKEIKEERYYKHIPKKKLKLSTKINMYFSDKLNMVKMIHIIF